MLLWPRIRMQQHHAVTTSPDRRSTAAETTMISSVRCSCALRPAPSPDISWNLLRVGVQVAGEPLGTKPYSHSVHMGPACKLTPSEDATYLHAGAGGLRYELTLVSNGARALCRSRLYNASASCCTLCARHSHKSVLFSARALLCAAAVLLTSLCVALDSFIGLTYSIPTVRLIASIRCNNCCHIHV